MIDRLLFRFGQLLFGIYNKRQKYIDDMLYVSKIGGFEE